MLSDIYTDDFIEVVGIALLLALAIVTSVIFNIALLNGGTTTVQINRYDEAMAEVVLLYVVVWPTISVAIYQLHRRFSNT